MGVDGGSRLSMTSVRSARASHRLELVITLAIVALFTRDVRAQTEGPSNPELEQWLRERPASARFAPELARLDSARATRPGIITGSLELSARWRALCDAERGVANAIVGRVATCDTCSPDEVTVGLGLAVAIADGGTGGCVMRAFRFEEVDDAVRSWLQVVARSRHLDRRLVAEVVAILRRGTAVDGDGPEAAVVRSVSAARLRLYDPRVESWFARLVASGPEVTGDECEDPSWNRTQSFAAVATSDSVRRAYLDPDSLRGMPYTHEERRQILAEIRRRLAAQGGPPMASRAETERLLGAVQSRVGAASRACRAPTSDDLVIARTSTNARPVSVSILDVDDARIQAGVVWRGVTSFQLSASGPGRATDFASVFALIGALAPPPHAPGSSGGGLLGGFIGASGPVGFIRTSGYEFASRASSDFDDEAIAAAFRPLAARLEACPHAAGYDEWTVTVEYGTDGRVRFVEAFRPGRPDADVCLEEVLRDSIVTPSDTPRRFLLGRISVGLFAGSEVGGRFADAWQSPARRDRWGTTFADGVRVRDSRDDLDRAFTSLDYPRARDTVYDVVARCHTRSTAASDHTQIAAEVTLELDERGTVMDAEASSRSALLDECIEAELVTAGFPCRPEGSSRSVSIRTCAFRDYAFPVAYFEDLGSSLGRPAARFERPPG